MSYFGVSPIVSTANSTSTPLSGGATFTGTWTLASRSMLLIQSYANVVGTLYIDFSVNGTNADSTFPSAGVTASASTPLVFPCAVGGRYYRIRYTNGGSAQATFRLGTSECDITNFYAPMNNPYNLNSPAILTRQSLPWLDIARSLVTGITTIKKFGRNSAVGTSFVPIALGGVWQTPQSASATTLRIKAGGNANDTAAGSGARSVTLVGTDANFAELTETVATAGASASSATSGSFTRINRLYVASSGTYATAAAGSHSAAITIENGSGGTDWATIDATNFPKGQGEIGAYCVPAGKTAYVFLRQITVDSTKSNDLVFFWRDGADDTAAPYSAMRSQSVVIGLKSNLNFPEVDAPLGPYVGPCDIGFMGKVDAGTASLAVEFDIYLVSE